MNQGMGIVRSAVTGALVLGVLFALCWVGAAVSLGAATHRYIALFTDADVTSATALTAGLPMSLLFGALAGALVAVVHRFTAFLDRR